MVSAAGLSVALPSSTYEYSGHKPYVLKGSSVLNAGSSLLEYDEYRYLTSRSTLSLEREI